MGLRVHALRMGLGVAHLVEAEGGMLLVDAGVPAMQRLVRRKMARLGRDDLKLIFITHAHIDHYGSAAAIRRMTGAPIAVHEADADAMARGETPLRYARGLSRLTVTAMNRFGSRLLGRPTAPDITLADGDTLDHIGATATVLHTPGHTAGSSCLLVGDGLAFVGDLLQGQTRAELQSAFAIDWELLPRSLRRLQEAGPRLVYTGHRKRPFDGAEIQRLG